IIFGSKQVTADVTPVVALFLQPDYAHNSTDCGIFAESLLAQGNKKCYNRPAIWCDILWQSDSHR
ncbi:MAG: hypothetical protein M3247_03530, partial [Thermoproteota archaeon]|nr:hypothetical protein [Thermoproteota archaeon]